MKPEPFVSCADSGPLTILGENNQSDGGPSRVVFCSGPAPHTAVQSSQTGCVAVTRVSCRVMQPHGKWCLIGNSAPVYDVCRNSRVKPDHSAMKTQPRRADPERSLVGSREPRAALSVQRSS